MQVLSSLRRRTKTGVSVWHFCYIAETKQFFAVGGDDMKVISCSDRKHLRQVYQNFKRYGYASKLRPIRAKKSAPITDPWDSKLPLDFQLELDALAVT